MQISLKIVKKAANITNIEKFPQKKKSLKSNKCHKKYLQKTGSMKTSWETVGFVKISQ